MQVLIVDGEPERSSEIVRLCGERARIVTTCDEFEKALDADSPQLVFFDYQMLRSSDHAEAFFNRLRTDPGDVIAVALIESGKEELAIESLRAGASNFLFKPVNEDFLGLLLEKYEDRVERRQRDALLRKLIVAHHARLVLPTDGRLVTPVADHILSKATEAVPGIETSEIRLGLEEILRNAVEHGNLEIGFDAKRKALEEHRFDALIEERMRDCRYRDRKVLVSFAIDRLELRCVIRDDGPGFDYAKVWDPLSEEGLRRLNGRGIFLTRAFFDEVNYRGRGNEVELVKQLKRVDDT